MNEVKGLQRKVLDCLLASWDPIGVNGTVASIDEYDTYVGKITRMLISGAPSEDIASELIGAEYDMGLAPDKGRADRAAAQLKMLHAA